MKGFREWKPVMENSDQTEGTLPLSGDGGSDSWEQRPVPLSLYRKHQALQCVMERSLTEQKGATAWNQSMWL